MSNRAALVAWWVKRNLRPMIHEAAKVVPMRTLGEALVGYGVTILHGDGMSRDEVVAVVDKALAGPSG